MRILLVTEGASDEPVAIRLVDTILKSLPRTGRGHNLLVTLMSPCQSTEAWLAWGIEDEDGTSWEKVNRHALKIKLFGNPPRGLTRKAQDLAEKLIGQMVANEKWPRSLRNFMDHLRSDVRL